MIFSFPITPALSVRFLTRWILKNEKIRETFRLDRRRCASVHSMRHADRKCTEIFYLKRETSLKLGTSATAGKKKRIKTKTQPAVCHLPSILFFELWQRGRCTPLLWSDRSPSPPYEADCVCAYIFINRRRFPPVFPRHWPGYFSYHGGEWRAERRWEGRQRRWETEECTLSLSFSHSSVLGLSWEKKKKLKWKKKNNFNP